VVIMPQHKPINNKVIFILVGLGYEYNVKKLFMGDFNDSLTIRRRFKMERFLLKSSQRSFGSNL
jgi:hypothetical protein